MRLDGRECAEIRPITFTPNFISTADGSVLVEFGNTRVICAVTVEDKVPPFLRGAGKGWITAEYSMLPASTAERSPRESTKGKVGGRTYEIQRLIGRSLRSIVDLVALGERTLWVDCDVIEADGGTRTASVTGAFVALCLCLAKLKEEKKLSRFPVKDYLAAISVGIVDGVPTLDLCYQEDSRAEVDMNVVMTGEGHFVEVQGTGEESTFTRQQLNEMLSMAEQGIRSLQAMQRDILGNVDGLIGSAQ